MIDKHCLTAYTMTKSQNLTIKYILLTNKISSILNIDATPHGLDRSR